MPLKGARADDQGRLVPHEAGYNPQPVHPHMFRHTFANDWLPNSGAEGDLMRLAGWKTRSMLDRYGADMAQQRAIEAKPHGRPVLGPPQSSAGGRGRGPTRRSGPSRKRPCRVTGVHEATRQSGIPAALELGSRILAVRASA